MYTTDLVDSIIEMRKIGKILKAISNDIGFSIFTVQWVLCDCKKKIKCKTDPKCHLNKCLETEIKRYVKKCNEMGKKVMCEKIIKELHVDVLRKMINNWLLRQDYKYKKQAQRIQLSDSHKQKDWTQCLHGLKIIFHLKNLFSVTKKNSI